jgi:hypothetical protein
MTLTAVPPAGGQGAGLPGRTLAAVERTVAAAELVLTQAAPQFEALLDVSVRLSDELAEVLSQ